MKKIIALLLATVMAFSLTGAVSSVKTDTTLNISAHNIAYEISDGLYGLSLEDISFSCDGGLVSNLINNNSFEYLFDSLYGWNIDAQNYYVSAEGGLNTNNKQYLTVCVKDKGSIENTGYTEIYNYGTYNYNEKKASVPDMGFKKGGEYEFSAYFKNVDFDGTITASLNAKGSSQKYSFDLENCNDWTQIQLTLGADAASDGGFLLTAHGNGTFYVDFVTLTPVDSYGYGEEQWKYTALRSDMVEAVKELSPAFIKFPGITAESEYPGAFCGWKDTIGPLEERVQTYNIYHNENNGRKYINTNAMGYYEYFTLCDDLGAEPVPVVGAGIVCQPVGNYSETEEKYRNGELTYKEWKDYSETAAITPDTLEWGQYVQDVLDLIEYANGGTDTVWGAKRAENGHPEPFNMKYIAVGNENSGEIYRRNFDALCSAVKEKYSDITVIANSGKGLEGENFDSAWITANSKYRDAIVDEHYDTPEGALFGNTERYDSYERGGAKVMIGSYAPNSESTGTAVTKNNFMSAVENGAYLTGAERNGDVVKMVSYAPAFSKIGAQCRDTSLVWFDSQSLVYTPDYFVQLLFANNYGTHYITTDLDNADGGIYHCVTVDKDEQAIYVKLVNSTGKKNTVEINLEGFENANNATVQYMSETFKSAANEIGESYLRVAPREEGLRIKENSLKYEMGGLSVSVIRIPYGENDGEGLYSLPNFGIIMPYIPTAIEIAVPCVLAVLLAATAVTVLTVRYIPAAKTGKRKKKKNK